jgi:predicted DNA-binding transcriptional regulator AlpA
MTLDELLAILESHRKAHPSDDELLDVYAACAFLGGSRPIHPATLWRGVKSGRYSKPIKISPQLTRWRRSELQADVERAIAARERKAA